MAIQFRIYKNNGYIIAARYDTGTSQYTDQTPTNIPTQYLAINIIKAAPADLIAFSCVSYEKPSRELARLPYNEIYDESGVLYSGSDVAAVRDSLIAALSAGGGGGGGDATAANQALQITEAQTANNKLTALITAVNNQKTGIDAQILVDANGVYMVRREIIDASGNVTLTFWDLAGVAVVPVPPLNPINPKDGELRNLQHKAINSGAGYNVDDVILETQAINLTVSPPVIYYSFWYNATQNTNIAQPTPADIVLTFETGLAKETTLQSVLTRQADGSQVSQTRKFPTAEVTANQISTVGEFAANLDGSVNVSQFAGVYLFLRHNDLNSPFVGKLLVTGDANGQFYPINAQAMWEGGQKNTSLIDTFGGVYFIPTTINTLKVECVEVSNAGGGLICAYGTEYTTLPTTDGSQAKTFVLEKEISAGFADIFIDVENYQGLSVQFHETSGGNVKIDVSENSSADSNLQFTNTYAYAVRQGENAVPTFTINDNNSVWLIPCNAKTIKLKDAGTGGTYRMFVYGHLGAPNTEFMRPQQKTLTQVVQNTTNIEAATNSVKTSLDTNLGLSSNTAASSDVGTFSLIALFKRYLQRFTAFFTAFGTETDGAAASDTANTGFISLIKRLLVNTANGNQKTQLTDALGVAIIGQKAATLSIPVVAAKNSAYRATMTGISGAGVAPAALASDVFSIFGSATAGQIVRVKGVWVSGTQTTAGTVNMRVVKRNSANTGGTFVAASIGAVDSNYAASTATQVGYYTANPAVGIETSTLFGQRWFLPAANTVYNSLSVNLINEPIDLRGTTQGLVVNFWGNQTIAGGSLTCTIEYEII